MVLEQTNSATAAVAVSAGTATYTTTATTTTAATVAPPVLPWLFPSHVSPGARAIIIGLLHPDPSQRLSIEAAGCHSWVTMSPSWSPRADCHHQQQQQQQQQGANGGGGGGGANAAAAMHNIVQTLRSLELVQVQTQAGRGGGEGGDVFISSSRKVQPSPPPPPIAEEKPGDAETEIGSVESESLGRSPASRSWN